METTASPVVTLTSPPRLSSRTPGYLWAYIDEVTPNGQACGVCLPVGSKFAKGDQIPRDQIVFNPEMGASVLVERSLAPTAGEPPLDHPPVAGWGDDPHPAAEPPRPGQYGMRGPAYRRQQALADAGRVASHLPNDFVTQLDLATRGYLYIAKRIGATEVPRPDIAKSLVITVLIQYLKQQGAVPADFSDEDMALVR